MKDEITAVKYIRAAVYRDNKSDESKQRDIKYYVQNKTGEMKASIDPSINFPLREICFFHKCDNIIKYFV